MSQTGTSHKLSKELLLAAAHSGDKDLQLEEFWTSFKYKDNKTIFAKGVTDSQKNSVLMYQPVGT